MKLNNLRNWAVFSLRAMIYLAKFNTELNKPLPPFLNRNLALSTMMGVYREICLSTLSYGCETLSLYRHHIKALEVFHTRCLKTCLVFTSGIMSPIMNFGAKPTSPIWNMFSTSDNCAGLVMLLECPLTGCHCSCCMMGSCKGCVMRNKKLCRSLEIYTEGLWHSSNFPQRYVGWQSRLEVHL